MTMADNAEHVSVACHRTVTNDAKWAWIDGPPSLGALDNLKVHPSWRIEYAYISQPQGVVGDEMVERAMNARIPGGAAAWVWLFNCEGGMVPQEKHRDWFRRVLTAALHPPTREGQPDGR
jgi:hypothetical protein